MNSMLTDEQIIELGSFSEQLLNEPSFQYLSAYYEQQLLSEMLATQAHETKKREAIYNKVIANRDFLAMFGHFAKQKQEAEKEPELDEVDDPSVHNIYG